MSLEPAGRSVCATALQIHAGDVHRRSMAFHNHDAGVGDVIELAVTLEIVADYGVGGDADVLVENSPANAGPSADVAIVENDGILDVGVRMDANAAADNGSPDQASG